MTNNFENKNYMHSINEEMQHAPIGLGFSSFGMSWLDYRDLVTLIMVVLHDLNVNFELNHHLSL
jgi:hypothetical protein